MRPAHALLLASLLAGLGACAASTPGEAPPGVGVAVRPPTAEVRPGGTVTFTAAVTGAVDTSVDWSVDQGAAGGTVSAGGLYTAPASTGVFRVRATSRADASANGAATVTVAPATPPPLAVSTTSLPGGTAGSPYSAGLAAAGGTPPYGWAVTSGALPGGLTLAPATGAIGGTPAAAGTFAFTAQATDAAGATAARALSISVLAAGGGTSVGGTLSANATWTPAGSPYRVTGNLLVAKGAKLTIQPGVTVLFTGHYRLEVRGQIDARGTSPAQRDILFTASDHAVGWDGIRLRGDNAISGQERAGVGSPHLDQWLQNCVLEYGDKRTTVPDEANGNYADQRGGCLWTFEQRLLHLDGNLFRFCKSGGNATGDFGDNSGAVVMFYNNSASEAVFTGNDFEDNWSHGPGGAFAVYHSNPAGAIRATGIRLRGGRFLRNTAERNNYTFYPFTALGSTSPAFGGAAAIYDAAAVLEGVTLGTGADANAPDDYARAHDSTVTVQ